MPIITRYKYLRAAVIHTAKNDVRFHLTGVYLGDGFISATDGYRMIMIEDNIYGLGLIIPRDTILSLIKKLGTRRDHELSIEIKDDGFGLISCAGEFEYFKFIDGKFPDVKRVDIPEPTEPVACWNTYNASYVKDFEKSLHILQGNPHSAPMLKPRDENSAIYVCLTDTAHGILMPMRM